MGERYKKIICHRCNGTQWLGAIDHPEDGSYVTMRPCSSCQDGYTWTEWTQEDWDEHNSAKEIADGFGLAPQK